jgi:cytidylate kinase
MTKTIAISRQRGSGGSYVGREVADRLGLRHIDRQMLHDASEYLCAQEATAEAAAAAATSSGGSWWSRVSAAFAIGAPEYGYVPPSSDAVYEGELYEMQQRIIGEVVQAQDSVIVGRGVAQTLRRRPGVISVFLFAPEPWRIARTQEIYGLGDTAAAERLVHESDRDRRRFIRAIADIEWTDAHAYDLAIDVSSIGLETTIDLIVRVAQVG